MQTLRAAISEVCRKHPIAVVGPNDFVRGDASAVEPQEVLRDPRFSLYCFDLENDTAHFVECRDPADVDAAAFYYQGQAEHAVSLVTMPLGVFHRIADEIPLPPKELIFVHSVGRWMQSIFNGFPPDRSIYDQELNRQMTESWSRTLPLVREFCRAKVPLNPIQIRLLGWITCMEGYLQLFDMGVPLAAARFEDLTENPVPVLQQFFAFCAVETVDWGSIHEVLGRDSQAGTLYDREVRRRQSNPLTESLTQDIRDLIATRPRLGTNDVVLPGTTGIHQLRGNV